MDWTTLLLTILSNGDGGSSVEGISSVVAIVVGAVTTIIAAVVKAINEVRRSNGHDTCCLTGRKLKPKAKKAKKQDQSQSKGSTASGAEKVENSEPSKKG